MEWKTKLNDSFKDKSNYNLKKHITFRLGTYQGKANVFATVSRWLVIFHRRQEYLPGVLIECNR